MTDPREQDRRPRVTPLEEGLSNLRTVLGSLAPVVLPEGKTVTGIEVEDFQSKTFQDAGFAYMPDRYPRSDRSLTTITFSDGSQTFVVAGKISSGNPYEVGYAADGALDLRRSATVVYEYDGDETIIERDVNNGQVETYHGEFGRPDVFRRHTVASMGRSVGKRTFE